MYLHNTVILSFREGSALRHKQILRCTQNDSYRQFFRNSTQLPAVDPWPRNDAPRLFFASFRAFGGQPVLEYSSRQTGILQDGSEVSG